jgi:hypothetical protein
LHDLTDSEPARQRAQVGRCSLAGSSELFLVIQTPDIVILVVGQRQRNEPRRNRARASASFDGGLVLLDHAGGDCASQR